MLKPLVLITLLAAATEVAAEQQFAGEVRRADQKPLAGIPVALVEDPGWWSFMQPTVIHTYAITDARGRFTVRTRGRRIRGRFALVAIGRVLRERVSAGTTVVTGTSVAVERPRTDQPNIIVVPLSFRPGPAPKLPKASNQAMQLTASKPVVFGWGVCRRASTLRAGHSGLAAADLVSR
jgi:hypothetical protein